MRSFTVGALTVVVGVLLTGCVAAIIGSAPQSGTATDVRARSSAGDTVLASTVRDKLSAVASLRAAAIDVSAARARVSLHGTVASAALRVEAERIARSVNGVAAVNNQLEVK